MMFYARRVLQLNGNMIQINSNLKIFKERKRKTSLAAPFETTTNILILDRTNTITDQEDKLNFFIADFFQCICMNILQKKKENIKKNFRWFKQAVGFCTYVFHQILMCAYKKIFQYLF